MRIELVLFISMVIFFFGVDAKSKSKKSKKYKSSSSWSDSDYEETEISTAETIVGVIFLVICCAAFIVYRVFCKNKCKKGEKKDKE